MTASPNRRYSGHHNAIEEEGEQGLLGKEISRKKCGQQDTSTAVGRWRWQRKTELDGDSGLWTMFHWESQGISKVSHCHKMLQEKKRSPATALGSTCTDLQLIQNTCKYVLILTQFKLISRSSSTLSVLQKRDDYRCKFCCLHSYHIQVNNDTCNYQVSSHRFVRRVRCSSHTH